MNQRPPIYFLLFFVLTGLLLSSCSNTKYLTEGQSFLVSNTINITTVKGNKETRNLSDEAYYVPIQKPNKKTASLLRTRLAIYNRAVYTRQSQFGKPVFRNNLTNFRNWLATKVGEKPVIYDEEKTKSTLDLLQRFMRNKGYFKSKISYRSFEKKHKQSVVYTIEPGPLYRFRTIQCDTQVARLYPFLSLIPLTKLKAGDPFDVVQVKEQLQEIEDRMRNQGYFYFSRDFVGFELDTLPSSNDINLLVHINQLPDSSKHKAYRIRKVLVNTDYSLSKGSEAVFDTLLYKDKLYLVSRDYVKLKTLDENIYMQAGTLYRLSNHKYTVEHLNDLGIFKFINIEYVNPTKDSLGDLIDVWINLNPAKRQYVSLDFDANNLITPENSENDFLAISGSLNYRSRNLSKIADHFSVDVGAGLDFDIHAKEKTTQIVSAVDLHGSVNYYLNKLLLPFRAKFLGVNSKPKTHFYAAASWIHRIGDEGYDQQKYPFSFGYEFFRKNNQKHTYNPFLFSYVKTYNKQPLFLAKLDRYPSLNESFQDQVILGADYSYFTENVFRSAPRHSYKFLTKLETSGNLARLAGLALTGKIDNSYVVGVSSTQIPFSQYARGEVEFRHSYQLNKLTVWANRAYLGLGLPYGNSRVLPYIKQYTAGGPYSNRGFIARSLGPGIYKEEEVNSSTSFFQTGEMKFELNTELRFGLWKWFRGALFVDAGNVWNIRHDTLKTGDQFKFNSFYKELALSSGFGIRGDFSYFVLRFDIGFPIYFPGNPSGDKWVIRNLQPFDKNARYNSLKLNIAIGYPF